MSNLKARQTTGRYPCGFCGSGHHGLCPGTIRNGSAAPNPTWTCPCSEQDHGLGGAHREPVVQPRTPVIRTQTVDEVFAMIARSSAEPPSM